jgi:hypothetical protein
MLVPGKIDFGEISAVLKLRQMPEAKLENEADFA